MTKARLTKLKVKRTGVAGTRAKTIKERIRSSWLKTENGSLLVLPWRLFLLVEKVLIGAEMKERKPSSPVVVRMVSSSFEEFEKRTFQIGRKFSLIGLSLVYAVKNVSGPVPRKAVRVFLKMSMAMDQPAERGRSIRLASGVEGKR